MATRFVSHEEEEAASLYYAEGSAFQVSTKNIEDLPGLQGLHACIVAGLMRVVRPGIKPLWEHFFAHSGFMKDAIQVVIGGKETGAKLLAQKPDKVHFTGSVNTGKKLMEACAKQLIPIDLELGGKDPSIVFDDVDLDRTVNGIMWGAFTNAGQNCTGIERLYVQEGIYDKLVPLFS